MTPRERADNPSRDGSPPAREHRVTIAPQTLLIVAGGGLVLMIPGQQLVKIGLWSQVLNGGGLPFVLGFMLLLINKKELMGEYVTTRLFNFVAWTTTILVTVLSLALALAMMTGKTGG